MQTYWDKTYETGILEIDLQHQEILRLLNLVSCSSSAKQSRDMLVNLLAYMRQHFSAEEKFMLPEVDASTEHKRDHERLAEAVTHLFNKALTLQLSRIEKECRELIHDVLVEHTWRFDRPLAVSHAHQAKKDSSASQEASLA